MKKWIPCFLVTFMILLAGCQADYINPGNRDSSIEQPQTSQPQPVDTPSTPLNSDFFAVDDTHLYYVNMKNGGSLWRVRLDMTMPEKLNDESSWFVLVGDILYFTEYDVENPIIYSMNKAGGDKKKLLEHASLLGYDMLV